MKKNIFMLLVVFLVSGYCVTSAYAQSGKKAVLVIAQKDFQDDEFGKPFDILKENGFSVVVASSSLGEATGTNGSKVKPEVLLKDVKAEDFDAVVFIGGPGAAQYLQDPAAHKLAQDAVAKNKILGGICLAPEILANAGVLKDKKATVYPSESQILADKGALYTGSAVEKDGNIITADGPQSAEQFGQAPKDALKGGGE
jgi:protease I